MKTGIELIAIERQEQIEKHHRSIESDIVGNNNKELSAAARELTETFPVFEDLPDSWKGPIMEHAMNKPYKERLIIAGALIAAEIDRISK